MSNDQFISKFEDIQWDQIKSKCIHHYANDLEELKKSIGDKLSFVSGRAELGASLVVTESEITKFELPHFQNDLPKQLAGEFISKQISGQLSTGSNDYKPLIEDYSELINNPELVNLKMLDSIDPEFAISSFQNADNVLTYRIKVSA